MIHIFNFSRFPISPNMMYSVRVSHPFTAPAASQGCPTKSKVEVDVDVSITLTSDFLIYFSMTYVYEFQFSICSVFCTKKKRKLLSAHPVMSKYLLSISWWGQLISPNLHLSSLQIPDPHPASNLFSFLNQQNFLSTIDIL